MTAQRWTLIAGATLLVGALLFWSLGGVGTKGEPRSNSGDLTAPTGSDRARAGSGQEEFATADGDSTARLRLGDRTINGRGPDGTDSGDRRARMARDTNASSSRAVSGSPYGPDDDAELEISGRVVTRYGEPIAGIVVVARAHYPGGQDGNEPSRRDDREHRGIAGEDGRYRIAGLRLGDYEIQTLETELFPMTRTLVQAGTESVDIALERRRAVQLYGVVRDKSGRPIAGARVIPGHLDRETRTRSDGSYDTELVTQETRSYALRFLAKGYEGSQITLRGHEVAGREKIRFDVELEDAFETTEIYGTLLDGSGDRLPDERVQLKSKRLRAHYSVETDADGNFEFPEVKLGPEYRLSVFPKQGYRDYQHGPFEVGSSERPLKIVLEPLDTARLSGRMLNPEGRPIPDFRLWLRSTHAQARNLPLSGDDDGRFVVDDAPEGTLMITTRSVPHLEVMGVTLRPGQQKEVELVLDWGEDEFEGTVVDERGDPVAGANLSLTWTDVNGSLESRSLRRGISDDRGWFRFTQLGPGIHHIEANGANYATNRARVDVRHSSEIELQLLPAP